MTIVRRLSADTRLNGGDFTEAPLVPGDRLGIGPIELEVLDGRSAAPADIGPSPVGVVEPEECSQERQLVEALRERVERDLADRARELDASRTQLESLRERLAVQSGALEREIADWTAQRAEIETQLCRQAEELKSRRIELDARQASVEARETAVEAEAAELDERRRQAESAKPPLESEQVFRRLGIMYPTDSEEADADRQEPSPPEVAQSSARPAPLPAAAGDEEESVAQYMERLLSRTRSVTGRTSSTAADPPASPVRPTQTDRPAAGQDEPEGTSQEACPDGRRNPFPLAPRAAAPERSANLSAMRDLANLSAQTALDRHAQDRHRRAVRTKLSMALLGTVFGSLMTFLWWRGHADTGLLTGTAGYLVALVWGLQYAVLKRKSPA